MITVEVKVMGNWEIGWSAPDAESALLSWYRYQTTPAAIEQGELVCRTVPTIPRLLESSEVPQTARRAYARLLRRFNVR